MASPLHSAFCFEVLNASLEHDEPPSLGEVERLWNHYVRAGGGSNNKNQQPGVSLDTSSTHLQNESIPAGQANTPNEAPMFVTWDTISSDDSKCLRGCIGTFEPLELEEGLKTYSRIA